MGSKDSAGLCLLEQKGQGSDVNSVNRLDRVPTRLATGHHSQDVHVWGRPSGGPQMPVGQGQTQFNLYFGRREQGSNHSSAKRGHRRCYMVAACEEEEED